MRTVGRRIAGSILLAASGLGAIGATVAVAIEPTSTGWWWSGRPSQTFPVRLDPLVPVSEGGLYVSSDPSGTTGVSALRVVLAHEASSVELTLEIDESLGTPLVDACPAGNTWQPEEGGTWDQRPQADCTSARVAGVPNEDGSMLVFDLGGLVRMRTVDIVLLPSQVPDSTVGPTFATSFRAPDSETLVVRDVAASTGSGPPQAPATTAGAAVLVPPDTDPSSIANPSSPPHAPPRSPGLDVAPTPITPAAQVSPPVPAVAGATGGFQYSVILYLPLILMGGASYVAWALTRPVTIERGLLSTEAGRAG